MRSPRIPSQSVWDLKEAFEGVGSGLEIRVGMVGQVVNDLLDAFKLDDKGAEIMGVWMTDEEGVEEKERRGMSGESRGRGKEFKLWVDEILRR
jgi:deoxyribodipyrimidine photo-lyase